MRDKGRNFKMRIGKSSKVPFRIRDFLPVWRIGEKFSTKRPQIYQDLPIMSERKKLGHFYIIHVLEAIPIADLLHLLRTSKDAREIYKVTENGVEIVNQNPNIIIDFPDNFYVDSEEIEKRLLELPTHTQNSFEAFKSNNSTLSNDQLLEVEKVMLQHPEVFDQSFEGLVTTCNILS